MHVLSLGKVRGPPKLFLDFWGIVKYSLKKKKHFKTCHPDGDEAGNLYFHDGLSCDFEVEWATSVRS